jgi:hypothetical protein
MHFRITGLPAEPFQPLFALDDAELAAHGAVRSIADGRPAFPCRVSLTDAAAGDRVVLVNFLHQPANSPYRSRHAIYVRPGERTFDAIDHVPEMLRRRLLSLRAFDSAGMMNAADVVEGNELEAPLEALLADARTAYVHLHFAKPGCYAARVERA